MGKIIQLDDHLSNKIAAGEVVERPASVVKELVENAIDAHSSRIEVELEEGGLSSIRVLDNGVGILPEDCELAFSRHATSKIKTEQDLYQIRTMGFRGEALPSIASVSLVELTSGTGEGPGTFLSIQNGKIMEKNQSNSRKGTDFLVKNLFYNTPARLKHVKTIQTELGNTTDILNRLALAHPNISFRLKHNGREIMHTSGNGNLLQVISSIYGIQTAKQMVSVSFSSLDYEVEGFVSKPEVNRASRNYISLFMNGRYIKNYAINKAIQQAYHTLLPIGRFPVVALSIKMDPALIDVNVHPAKQEARLSKEQELTSLVEEGIRNALKKLTLIPHADVAKVKTARINDRTEQPSFTFEHTASFKTDERNAESAVNLESSPLLNVSAKQDDRPIAIDAAAREERDHPYTERQIENKDEEPDQSSEEPASKIPVMYPIGQMHGTYILAQNENGLYMIDQHAAQERLKYEFFRKNIAEVNNDLQQLALPFTFEYSSQEADVIRSSNLLLQQAGIFLEPFGMNAFIVREHPQWFPKGFEKETIEDIIHQVLQNSKISIEKLREEAAIMMSCKGSIKANRHLRNDEIFALLESLRKSEDPFTCPHGRPITIHLSTYELEKMFKRIM